MQLSEDSSINQIHGYAIGNPLSYYNGTRWTFTWEDGRQLATATDGTTNVSYTYDSDGIRTSKTVNGTKHTYVYASGKLLRETYGDTTIDFFYSTSGQPYALTYNGTTYYYITNLQGDVMSIVDGTGTVVASYEYDPYGNIISATGELAEINPLRYRGYVYDTETGLYYLQSRYYDPEMGRFINADALASTGQGILGNNMFAYCNNNPCNKTDSSGHCSYFWFIKINDCGMVTCRDSENYDPDPPRAAVIYDARDSGFLRRNGKGFEDHGSTYAMALKTSHDVEEYPFTDMAGFVKAWNSLSGEYDRVIIMAHGYAGGMSCDGASISNSSKEDYNFGDLNPVPAVTVYLYTCHGATIDAKGNSVAMIFAYLTGGNVWAVYNGKLSYDYWTLMPYPTEGGIWSVTKSNTTTIMGG